MSCAMRYADASDEELLAMSGERPEAFGVFYGRFEGEVLAFFVKATRRAEVAADLAAEVFAAALVAAARL
jgi:DNA-directed RNA polymerase specialized sigma24 family protein